MGCGALFGAVRDFDSGGPLSENQAAYDVRFYDIDLKIDNAIGVARYVSNSADVIDGRELLDEGIDNDIAVRALVEEPTGTLVLDVELGIGDVEVTHVP